LTIQFIVLPLHHQTNTKDMKAQDIKITTKTFLINEIRDNGTLVGFERVINSANNSNTGGTSTYYNLDGSMAYKSQMEGLTTKRVFYKGEWIQ